MNEHDEAIHDCAASPLEVAANVLTVRSFSGLSGDMLLTGLGVLALKGLGMEPDSGEADAWLAALSGDVMDKLAGVLKIRRHFVAGVGGFQALINLPHEHEHRNLADIEKIIQDSRLSEAARTGAIQCFELLAHAEASIHGKAIDEIHFHEVGALDSILDICLAWELFTRLNIDDFVCGPLPLADGSVRCAHGLLPAPAPATLELLKNIPVTGFCGDLRAGELVTPTAVALIRALPASFGPWPSMMIENTALAYGQKVFPDAPNGVIFALGKKLA